MLIGVVATLQIAKPLWATPMVSSSAAGLMLLFPLRDDRACGERGVAKGIVLLSAVAMIGFLAYLFVADVVTASRGEPMVTYAADTRKLGAAVEDFWKAHASGPLECVVIAERSLAASTVLWTCSRPHYVDFIEGFWSTPSRIARCRKSGGVVVLTHIPGEQAIFEQFSSRPQRAAAVGRRPGRLRLQRRDMAGRTDLSRPERRLTKRVANPSPPCPSAP